MRRYSDEVRIFAATANVWSGFNSLLVIFIATICSTSHCGRCDLAGTAERDRHRCEISLSFPSADLSLLSPAHNGGNRRVIDDLTTAVEAVQVLYDLTKELEEPA